MPIFDGNLPYTNLHELNLDWIVKIVKEIKGKTDEIDNSVETAENYATLTETYYNLISNVIVTPEMFGAIGDGIADDTQAIQDAINSGHKILLNNRYRITDTISIVGDMYLYGSGKIYMSNKNVITSMFNVQTSGTVICKDVMFYSERENVNVYPPAGHTRATGSRSSNVIAFVINAVDNFVLDNCYCDSLEYDVKTTLPSQGLNTIGKICLINHTSKESSTAVYVSHTDTLMVSNSDFTTYSLLGSGDHCFYGSALVNNVYINDTKINSTPVTGTTYDLHFFNSTNEPEGKNIYINNVIMNGNSFFATNYSGEIIVKNSVFNPVSIQNQTERFSPLYVKEADLNLRTIPVRFDNCYFGPAINQASVPLRSPLIFNGCEFDGWRFNIDIENEDDTGTNTFEFNNCSISTVDTETISMFYCGSNTHNYEINVRNSHLKQLLGDGVASLRGSGTQIIAFYNCDIYRTTTKPYLEYASSYNGIYKFFNCCSENGKIRGTGSGTFVDVNNGFAP